MLGKLGWNRLPLAVVMFTLVAPFASAQVRRHDVPDSAYLAYGASPLFQDAGVGNVWVQYEGSQDWVFKGTGFPIARDRVATTGHELQGNDGWGGNIVNVKFQTGLHLDTPEQVVYGTEFYFHEDYDPAAAVGQDTDAAVLYLDQPLTGITPLPMWDDPAVDPHGLDVEVASFGWTGTGYTGWTELTGDVRGFESRITHVGGDALFWYSSVYVGMKFPIPLDARPLHGTLAPGGSGSPLAVLYEGEYYWRGMGAFAEDDGTYLTVCGALDLSYAHDFYQSHIPEPSSLALIILAAVMLPRRR